MDQEIYTLLQKGVIEEAYHSHGEFLSNVFLRPKKDGSFRMILNLKNLNSHVEYNKFKMDTLQSILKLVTPGCYMATIDLKDAYYSVPVAQEHRKYLRFVWRSKLYQYTCFPNGLSSAPRLFTKLMKPCYAHLRCRGHIVSGYIDDTYLQQQLFNDALNSLLACKSLFTSLGLLIHPEKSLDIPSQIATVLGFIINSLDMTISLTTEKKTSLIELCHRTMQSNQITIRDLARLNGKLVSSFPGVAYGPLFYRDLEMAKTEALKLNRGNYDSTMVLSDDMKSELQWWVDNLETATCPISNGNPDIVIDTDASLIGWGAVCNAVTAQGSFTPSDVYYAEGNINVLELLAVKYGLQSFASIIKNRHILVRCDNSTAVSYISNMGGTHSGLCNAVAKEIWLWTMTQGVWLTITHIPGKLNKEADFGSRNFNDRTEWSLDPSTFELITKKLGQPEIDLFASYSNAKVACYYSWKPDPGAAHVDAFTVSWSGPLTYCFPPFSLLGRCLQKIAMDQAECIVLIPNWPTQPYYSKVMEMLVSLPLVLPCQPQLLQLPHDPLRRHPLFPKLQLLACKLSGNPLRAKTFQGTLPTLSSHLGAQEHRSSIRPISTSGLTTVVKGNLIHFIPL